MKHIHTSAFLFLLVSIGSTTASAALTSLSATMSDQGGSVVVVVPQEFAAVRDKMSENLPELFRSIPKVKSVSNFARPEMKVLAQTEHSSKKAGNRALVMSFDRSFGLPSSMLIAAEERADCSNITLDEATCPIYLTYKITGPAHSYTKGVEGLTAEDLAGKVELTLDVRPADRFNAASGTRVTMNFNILNRDYQKFFQKLERKGKLKAPLEKEVKGAFLLWGQYAMREFFR